MSFIKTLGQAVLRMIDRHQKSRVLTLFMEMSDKQLDDIGVSRAALSQGIKAYPWRDMSAELRTATTQSSADVLSFKKQPGARPVTVQSVSSQTPKMAA